LKEGIKFDILPNNKKTLSFLNTVSGWVKKQIYGEQSSRSIGIQHDSSGEQGVKGEVVIEIDDKKKIKRRYRRMSVDSREYIGRENNYNKEENEYSYGVVDGIVKATENLKDAVNGVEKIVKAFDKTAKKAMENVDKQTTKLGDVVDKASKYKLDIVEYDGWGFKKIFGNRVNKEDGSSENILFNSLNHEDINKSDNPGNKNFFIPEKLDEYDEYSDQELEERRNCFIALKKEDELKNNKIYLENNEVNNTVTIEQSKSTKKIFLPEIEVIKFDPSNSKSSCNSQSEKKDNSIKRSLGKVIKDLFTFGGSDDKKIIKKNDYPKNEKHKTE
jgi:hypothetical protein